MMSLAWPLFRVTEQAALAAWPQTGCGDKNKIDGLAVTAMRQALNDVAFRGRVVIGEGEIDHAPMLWIGEEVGKGDGPEVDIAVDPIESSRTCPRNSMLRGTTVRFSCSYVSGRRSQQESVTIL